MVLDSVDGGAKVVATVSCDPNMVLDSVDGGAKVVATGCGDSNMVLDSVVKGVVMVLTSAGGTGVEASCVTAMWTLTSVRLLSKTTSEAST